LGSFYTAIVRRPLFPEFSKSSKHPQGTRLAREFDFKDTPTRSPYRESSL
jgi:hypothetical protein